MNALRDTMVGALRRWLEMDARTTDEGGWALNLAVFRIVFIGAVALPWTLGTLDWAVRTLPGLPRGVWDPVSFYRWVPHSVLADAGLARVLIIADLGLLALGLLGLFSKVSLGLAAILSLYVLGLPQNLGKVDHYHHIVWFLAVLAVAPAGARLSIDAWRARSRPPATDGALWAMRALWILLGLVYLTPGLAKLESAIVGGWASGANLRHVLWRKWLELYLFDPGFTVPPRIDQLPEWLVAIGGAATIAFEVGFIFLVLLRPVRPLLALVGLLFHIGNGVFLGIWFTTLLPAYVVLIDWAALARRRAAAPPASAIGPPRRSLRVVATALIVAQAAISLVAVAAERAPDLFARESAAYRVSRGIGRRLPRWPFDGYPTFAARPSSYADIMEVRWVDASGAETRASPSAFAAAFGPSARCANIVEAILDEPDARLQRIRALDLVRALLRNEPADVRRATSGAAVYRVRYDYMPSPDGTWAPVRADKLWSVPIG